MNTGKACNICGNTLQHDDWHPTLCQSCFRAQHDCLATLYREATETNPGMTREEYIITYRDDINACLAS